ncbi:MAG: hypothetical protein CTY20_12160 [Hyphomicrobium sp.]|nr:MAG: hypothetical protein CTY20_12160 [Hyphomicrobium sp.]
MGMTSVASADHRINIDPEICNGKPVVRGTRKDEDFSDRVIASRSGPHVIHLRIGNMRLRAIYASLVEHWVEFIIMSTRYRLFQVDPDRVECIE